MRTKKVTLNELRSLVKQIIREEHEVVDAGVADIPELNDFVKNVVPSQNSEDVKAFLRVLKSALRRNKLHDISKAITDIGNAPRNY
jgi:F0F1-type ATP synthase delta subunit